MRWLLSLYFVLLAFGMNGNSFAQMLTTEIDAAGAIVINGETGAVLFSKNADSQFFPASITKIATALYVLKVASHRLDEKFVAKAEALSTITPQAKRDSRYRAPSHLLETDGTHIGIQRGEEITLRELLFALMLASANDAANVIAQTLGDQGKGGINGFMTALNRFCKEMGCVNTHFCNPHGLHHPDHVTTPKEMSILAMEAMRLPLFRQIVATVRYTMAPTNLHESRNLLQGNRLLRSGASFYPKAIGIKTGNHSQGRTLVAAATEKEGRLLIGVVMGYVGGNPNRYRDITQLFETGFREKPQVQTLLAAGNQKFAFRLPQAKKASAVYLENPLAYKFYPSEKVAVKIRVRCDKLPLPLPRGSRVGEIMAVDAKGRIVAKTLCYCTEEIKPTLVYTLKKSVSSKRGKQWGISLGLLAALATVIFLWRRSGTCR